MGRPRRPGFNTTGRAVRVLANYFGVKLNLREAHHYDVAIVGLKQPRGGAYWITLVVHHVGECQ